MPAQEAPIKGRHVILVGTDFGAASALAVLQAWHLATQRDDAELHVVHVIDDRGRGLTKNRRLRLREHLLETLPAQLTNHVMQLVQYYQLAPLHNPFRVHVRIGRPAREILELAADLDAAMAVVGSHDRGALDRLVTGSVSQQLVRAGRLPVLVSHSKHYEDVVQASPEAPEPPCPACLEVRRASDNQRFWCTEHARAHEATHVYRYTASTAIRTPFDTLGASSR